MDKEDIIAYAMKTPTNTNPNILRGMLGTLESQSGAGLPDVTTEDNGKILQVINGEWNKSKSDRLLPEVTVEDVGKTIAVSETGQWILSELGGDADAIIINSIIGEAGANFASQFSAAISAITSDTMRSHSQSKVIESETGQAIIETLAQDPTKSKNAYLFYSYGTHAHVVRCSQVFANQLKNMDGQYDIGDRIDFLFEGTVFQPAIADLATPIIKFVVDIYRVAMSDGIRYNCIIYGYGI